MNLLIASLGMLTFFVMSNAFTMEELTKEGTACAVELGIPPESLMSLVHHRDPALMCISACIMKRAGSLGGNGINLDKVLESTKSQAIVDPALLEAAVRKCVPIGNQEADECAKAGKFAECVERDVKPH